MIKLKKEVIKYAKKLNSTNLSILRSGNISLRAKFKNIEGFLITPSGRKYETLLPKEIVFVSLDGNYDKDGLKPSSEWKFHQDIYLEKNEANAIVHAHSLYATSLSVHGKLIPAFHYMVALAGGHDIKCSKYATFGTRALSRSIIKALKDRRACLMSNHGQVAYGDDLGKAFELAEEVENLCHQYLEAKKIGNPNILSKKEMISVLKNIKNYKN
ncbi:MAG: class II aldolase/adducin family protein [Alphaproteobacteria bacterium]|nr:class II aldolase/adducin family protein [Alphaproteobacteria bacterium]